MIENFSFGSITIQGKQYTSDLKILNGKVSPDWRRKFGHTVDVDEVADILKAKPDYLVIGSGVFGSMKLNDQLKQILTVMGFRSLLSLLELLLGRLIGCMLTVKMLLVVFI